MRADGVPNYPDPVVNGNGGVAQEFGGPGLDPNSPQFQAAHKDCQRLFSLAGDML
jgi:hypothetical protein